jgi:hypothetical protein
MASRFLLIGLLLAQLPAQSQIQVRVSRLDTSSGTLYQYRLIHNGRSGEITGLILGCDRSSRSDCELPTRPFGVLGAAGWTAEVIRTEEAELWQVDWTNTVNPVRFGERLCFGVLVNGAVAQYQTAHFTAYFGDGRNVAGQLVADDPVGTCSIPPVAITHPNLGEPLADAVTVSASVIQNPDRWHLVSMLVDGRRVEASGSGSNLQFRWNTRSVPNGEHTIGAVVQGPDGRPVNTGFLQANVENP